MDFSPAENSLDSNELLIQCVQGQPCIFNKLQDDFKDKTKKMRAWETIAQSLIKISGKDYAVKDVVKDAQSRWKSLRRVFMGEHKKMNLTIQSGSARPPATPQWKYYKMMMFLEPHIIHRPTVSNYGFSAMTDVNEMEIEDELDLAYDDDADSHCNEGTEELHAAAGIETRYPLEQEILINEKYEEKRIIDEYGSLLLDAFKNVPPTKKWEILNKLVDCIENEVEQME